MKLVLTGSTGFLGFRTLEKLIQIDQVQSIVATGRSLKETHKIDHPKVSYKLGDLSDFEFADELLKDATHIVHAAALSSPWGHYKEFERANITTLKNLMKSAEKNGIQRFVFISTPSMYFEMKDRFNIKESDPLPKHFINAYAETKRKAELELEKTQIPYITLRPRALIGRGDTVIMPRLIRAYDEGKLKVIGSGKNIADLTAVANVADAIWLSLIADETALNKVYNITNGEPVNLWESIADVLRKLGKKPPAKKVPFGVVKFIAGIMELKSKLTNKKEPPLTKYGVGTLSKSMTMDISKARELLNYNPKVNTEEAIDEFVKWYKENEKS